MDTILRTATLRRALAESNFGRHLSRNRPVLTWLRLIEEWLERARQRRHLATLDDHMLRDLGLSRADVARECDKPFWQS